MSQSDWYFRPSVAAFFLGAAAGAATKVFLVMVFAGCGSYLALHCIGFYIRESAEYLVKHPELSERQRKWFVVLGLIHEPRHVQQHPSRSTSSKE